MSETGEPHTPREITHARIGNLLFDLRQTLDDIIKLRLNPQGSPLVADEEAELLAIHNSLLWLLSDLRESRVTKLRVVQ